MKLQRHPVETKMRKLTMIRKWQKRSTGRKRVYKFTYAVIAQRGASLTERQRDS